MKLIAVGCSHHTASLDVRERLAFTADQTVDAVRLAQNRFPGCECVLLSTCNRVEFYLAADDATNPPASPDVIAFLAEYHRLDPASLSSELYVHHDEQAVRHLFLVAASLDSMVVGEAQILSQVKQAFAVARAEQAAGLATHLLFEGACRAAKRVATETSINRKRVSVPSIAVADFAKHLFETFHDKNVLLLGAGQTGEETLRYLKDERVRDIVILNRSIERARTLADRLGGACDSWENLVPRLAWADLVVSTTGSREPIMTATQFRAIVQRRPDRLLFILDLAVPRDFDPEIGQFSNVYLYCIDDLEAVCEANRRQRQKEWPKAERIVDQEVQRYLGECNRRATAPTIQRFRQQVQKLKDAEFQRLIAKLGAVDENARAEIEQSFERLVNKLLHPPLKSLQDEATRGSNHALLDALRHLFQIED
ncbi:MAG: glutamyl-tRNA reductase [Planctomycetes bacterium]|nr:glutamyl-tRNA reductase [Planctomycetota bacterium]